MSHIYPFLIYSIVTIFTPGPNNVMAMANGMHQGYRKTLHFLAGIFSGFFVVLLLGGFLNTVLSSVLPSLTRWLKILGAIYMVYLAIHIIRSKPAEDSDKGILYNSFKAGFLMQFINVKGILYSITIFSSFIIPFYTDPNAIWLFSIFLAMMCFVSISCWAIGGIFFRKFLLKYYRPFNYAMGGLLIYTAIASLV